MYCLQEHLKPERPRKQSIGGGNEWSKAQLKRLEEVLFAFGIGYFKDIRVEVSLLPNSGSDLYIGLKLCSYPLHSDLAKTQIVGRVKRQTLPVAAKSISVTAVVGRKDREAS